MKRIAVFCAAAAMLAVVPAAAQLPLSAPSLGMGGAQMGAARGQEAVLLNPANLGLSGTPHWSVSIPHMVIGGTLLGIRFGDIGDIRNYDKLTDAESRALLARVPASGTELEYDFSAPIAAFSAGRFGVGVTYHTSGRQGISYDLAELFLIGYELGRTTFDVRSTTADRVGYWGFSAAHGRQVGPVALGVTGHLYRGGTLVRSRLLDVDADGLDYSATYVSLRSEGGSGFGVDVGAAAEPIPGLTVSGSVGNALGSMKWSNDLLQRSATITREDVEANLFEARLADFRESERPYTGSPDPLVQELEARMFERTDLPRTLRVGASYEGFTGTQLSGAFHTTLNDSRLAGVWDQRFSLGVQQQLAFARLRAGVASDLDGGSLLSAGVGLGPVQLALARMAGASVGQHDRTGWVFSFGLATRSNSEVR